MELANLLGPTLLPALRGANTPTLHSLILNDEITPGRIFTFEGSFRVKGMGYTNQSPIATLTTSSELPQGKHLVVEFSRKGLITDTAYARLNRSVSNIFILGSIVEMENDCIRCIPYLIADLVEGERFGISFSDHCRLHLSDIDQLQNLDFKWTPTAKQFQKLAEVPESEVKKLLAKIFGELSIPADWGGEESDLFTSNILIGGERRTAAFLLKGPAKFHEMTLRDCGKNADQIYRLFNIPADVFIVQHCHRISPAVRKTVEAHVLATYRTSCKCAFIDGYDTARILRSSGFRFGPR